MTEAETSVPQPAGISNMSRRSLLGALAGLAAFATAPTAEGVEKPVTLEQAALMDFEPWDAERTFNINNADLRKVADHHLIVAHAAGGVMCKNKKELIALHKNLPEVDFLIENLAEAVTFFDTLREMLTAAEARLFVAGAAVELGA